MEENKSLIKIENRKSCLLLGVKKLDSFDDKEFLLDTIEGFLHIKGKGLSLGKMNMEEGELLIEGKIDSLSFINKTDKKDKSLLKKLFK
jgi:sporulation protein YabP